MSFAATVGDCYQFVLKDLKSDEKRMIRALTGLALEEAQYYNVIGHRIVQHVYNVDAEFKVYGIYLIDSISKRMGGDDYRHLFSQTIAELMYHVFSTGTQTVRSLLYKIRQTWNHLFPANILKNIDERIQQIDINWPYLENQRMLINEIKTIESQIKQMQKEVIAMEIAALEETSTNTYSKQTPIQSAVENKRKLLTVDIPENKMRKLGMDSVSPGSSVLLTPSPEPRTPSAHSGDSNDSSSFWMFLNKKSESEKSISPVENVEMSFLFESPKMCTNPEKIECNRQIQNPVEDTNANTNQAHSEVDVKEEKTQRFELDFNFDMTSETFANFQMYDDSATMTEIDETEEPEVNVEVTGSNESKASPARTISIDGVIEFEAIIPEPSKQIKINLINPKVVEESNSQSTELSKKIAINEMVQNNPNEWKTPSIWYDVKDSMKNAAFHVKPIYRGETEQSGLCSIM